MGKRSLAELDSLGKQHGACKAMWVGARAKDVLIGWLVLEDGWMDQWMDWIWEALNKLQASGRCLVEGGVMLQARPCSPPARWH